MCAGAPHPDLLLPPPSTRSQDSSVDVILFASLAIVIACLLQGRLATLMVLIIGERHAVLGSSRQVQQLVPAHARMCGLPCSLAWALA